MSYSLGGRRSAATPALRLQSSRCFVKAGHVVAGYDLNPAGVAALTAAGGKGAASAADAGKGADVVITMLPAGEHVREVWLNQRGLIEAVASAKPLLIDCSTIDVDSA